MKSRDRNQTLSMVALSRRQTRLSRAEKNIRITEIRTYVPLSHDYADLFANLVASLELCAATVDIWEIWSDKLRDHNSKQLVERMIAVLSRYLDYPEGRAFSLYQQKKGEVFLEITEKICGTRAELEAISTLNEQNLSKLERIEGKLNQLARNCRLEIQRLAKTETVEYSK